MTRLIHLNGPPGIGKSTLAELWVDRHPGTLNLDTDRLQPLVGGWRDRDTRIHEVLRPVALAMAATHLAGGRDVMMPQCLTGPEEVAAFEAVARDQDVAFREVMLLDDRDAAVARFAARGGDSAWDEHNRRLVETLGGSAWLADLHDRLTALLARRPAAVVVRSELGAVERTYAQLERALSDPTAR